MKKFMLRCFVAVLFVFSLMSVNAQSCYVFKDEASGFNVQAKQAELEAKACELVAAFDSAGFANQFKVFSFGFYMDLEYYDEYSYPQAFIDMQAKVAQESPYYLLIGRQNDHNEVFTNFWVDVKLPETGTLHCLSEFDRELVSIQVKRAINDKYENGGRIESSFHLAEIAGIETLTSIITEKTLCCNVQNKNFCSPCPTPLEIAMFFSDKKFKAVPIKIINSNARPIIKKKNVNSAVINYSPVQSIVLEGTTLELESNVSTFINTLSSTLDDIGVYISSNETFCDSLQINEIKQQFNSNKDVNFWMHIWDNPNENKDDLLLIFDKSEFEVSWCDVNTPYSPDLNNLWYTPFQFGGETPVVMSLDTLPIPDPPGMFKRAWNGFIGAWHITRALDYAYAASIPIENIYIYSLDCKDLKDDEGHIKGGGTLDLVLEIDELSGIEVKHVFRGFKKDNWFSLAWSESHDSKWLKWDNYWDEDNGFPIINSNYEDAECVMDAPFFPAQGIAKKGAVKVAKMGSGLYTVYIFMKQAGKYIGITNNFTRRMREHGASVLNKSAQELFTGLDYYTARGLEQILIEHGRKAGVLAGQISSIDKKRKKARLKQCVDLAEAYLQQHHPQQIVTLQSTIDWLKTFYP